MEQAIINVEGTTTIETAAAAKKLIEMFGNQNIRAISVADTSDISTVRFVVDDPEKGKNILIGNGHVPKETDVLAVEIPDHPGAVNAVLHFA